MTDHDKKRFAAAMVALYKTYNREPDKDISRILFHTLEHLSIEDAEKCIEFAIINGDKFPTPHALKQYVSMIPPKPLARLQYNAPAANADMAKDATKLITAALEGRLSEQQLVEGMTVMDKKYPHIGWASEAAQLVSYYRKRDQDVIEEKERDDAQRRENAEDHSGRQSRDYSVSTVGEVLIGIGENIRVEQATCSPDYGR